MQIQTAFSKSTIRSLTVLFIRRMFWKTFLAYSTITFISLLALALETIYGRPKHSTIVWLVVIIVVLPLGMLIKFRKLENYLRSVYAGSIVYEISSDKISIESKGVHLKFAWSDVTMVSKSGEFIMLITKQGKWITFYRPSLSEVEKGMLAEHLKENNLKI